MQHLKHPQHFATAQKRFAPAFVSKFYYCHRIIQTDAALLGKWGTIRNTKTGDQRGQDIIPRSFSKRVQKSEH